jgi:LPS O-antigen subunit length determinant protein (WzzB/FepE family)
MKRNSRILQDDEIDLSQIIKTLWNEKILILSISLIFMVVSYVYGALQPNIYKTEITIREAPSFLFEAYRPFFITQQQQGIAREFNDQVKLNLSSLDTLVQFVEEANTINDFKNYLKEKNISVKKYFQPQLGARKFEPVIDKKNNILNKYSLTYAQPLPGPSQGTFEELSKSNEHFKKMASHA